MKAFVFAVAVGIAGLGGNLRAAETKVPKLPLAEDPKKPATPVPPPPVVPSKPVKVRVIAPYLHVTRPGGAREQGGKLPKLVVLGTTNTTATVAESPVLYFYTSGSASVPVFFTLTTTPSGASPGRANAPVIEVPVGQAVAGVYGIDLGDGGVRLRAGESYEWSLATAVGGQTSSRDVVALGRIRYQPASAELLAERDAAVVGARHQVYLRHRLFHDALAELLPLLGRQPAESRLNADLNRILTEIGVVRTNLAGAAGARP